MHTSVPLVDLSQLIIFFKRKQIKSHFEQFIDKHRKALSVAQGDLSLGFVACV